MGQLADLKPECAEAVRAWHKVLVKQQNVVKNFVHDDKLSNKENEALLCKEKYKLQIVSSAYNEKKWELDWITLGHDPYDHAIHNLRVGENDFAIRYCKED